MKPLLVIVLIVGLTSCAGTEELAVDEGSEGDSPQAGKAYLIIGASLLPADERQPRWIGISRSGRKSYLRTTNSIFELWPGTYTVSHVSFDEIPKWKHFQSLLMGHLANMWFSRPIEVNVYPGKINYYGRLEIQEDADPHKHPSQLVLDRDLYRRACEQAPEVFRAFPVAATGPVSKYDLSFRDCDEILKDSESETDPAADQ
jgi:hypothetical protein